MLHAFCTPRCVFTFFWRGCSASRFHTILRHRSSNSMRRSLYSSLLQCAAPLTVHMTRNSTSAGAKPSDSPRLSKTTRPHAAHFFDQLRSHSQPTCIPPPSNVTTARDSAGAKRRALATDDDDILMSIAECAPLEAGKVRGLPSSPQRSSAAQDTTDLPPGDDDYFARALAPASVPRHFRGRPWDDKRLRRSCGVDSSSDPTTNDDSAKPVPQHASTPCLLAPPTPIDVSHFRFSTGMLQVPPVLTPASMPPRFVGVDPVRVHVHWA